MIQFDEHIFQMGWFNHQPGKHQDKHDHVVLKEKGMSYHGIFFCPLSNPGIQLGWLPSIFGTTSWDPDVGSRNIGTSHEVNYQPWGQLSWSTVDITSHSKKQLQLVRHWQNFRTVVDKPMSVTSILLNFFFRDRYWDSINNRSHIKIKITLSKPSSPF